MSLRTQRVAEELKHKLNSVMAKDLSELSIGLVTITNVMVSPDLKTAKIYVTFIGNKEPVDKCVDKLNERKRHIRFLLAKIISLKYTPDIIFYYDYTYEYADRIQKLLNDLKG